MNLNAQPQFTEHVTTETKSKSYPRRMDEIMNMPEEQESIQGEFIENESQQLTSDQVAHILEQVPEYVREASLDNDAVVQGEYAGVLKVANKLTRRIHENRESAVSSMAAAGLELDLQLERSKADSRKARDLEIAIIESQYQQGLRSLADAAIMAKQDIERVVETANSRLDNQTVDLNILIRESNEGLALQKANETRRIAAIDAKDELKVRYYNLEEKIATANLEKTELTDQLGNDETTLSELVTEENKLKTEKRKKIALLTEEPINELRNRFASDNPESTELRSRILAIKEEAEASKTLENTMQKLGSCEVRLDNTQENIKNVNKLIQKLELIIAEGLGEQLVILRDCDQVNMVLDKELSYYAPVRLKHGQNMAKIAVVLASVDDGNVTKAALSALPPEVERSFMSELAYKQALKNLQAKTALDQLAPVQYELASSLRLISTEEVAPEEVIIGERQRQRVLAESPASQVNLDSVDPIDMVRRIFGRGLKIKYDTNNNAVSPKVIN